MFSTEPDSGRKHNRNGNLSRLCNQDRFNSLLFISSYHLYCCLSLDYCLFFISKLTVTHLNDIMVNTRNRRGDPEPAMLNENPPPSSTLAQAIASILESMDEQT
jgi:hypothetical protein